MKDSLFELLMNFFEKSLSQIKENSSETKSTFAGASQLDESKTLIIQAASPYATRIFAPDEQIKMTKASYQLMIQLFQWQLLNAETLEQIIDQLLLSESQLVNLQETKWTIRNILADQLKASDLAFLDLVLYQQEDQLPLH